MFRRPKLTVTTTIQDTGGKSPRTDGTPQDHT
jgi:hypothetical protein